MPIEAKSSITVLVDLSGTWLNDRSRTIDQRELEAVSATIATMVPSLKAPVEIRYLEIGDGSLSRPPLCAARYVPNIFHTVENVDEFADIQKLSEFFGEDCVRLILMRKPEAFTDITGALSTVSRISASEASRYRALIILSDFREERRLKQKGDVGPLPGLHAVLLYRVLNEDRLDPSELDSRIARWLSTLRRAGARPTAVDDIVIEPAQIKRLLTQ
jgi:hypothetical protein